jgi:two-component sensor histidine kinase
LSNATGKITISWQIIDDEMFRLIWQESGGPEVKAPDGTGFGTVVLEDMLAMALGATTQVTFDPSGLRWTLDCPVQAIMPR